MERRLSLLEAAVKALDERLERVEKISDHNAEVHRDVTAMMGAEVTIIRLILEDMVRGDTIMKAIGRIDFDEYLRLYNKKVVEELRAKEEEQKTEPEEETDAEEVFEFGGDYGANAKVAEGQEAP